MTPRLLVLLLTLASCSTHAAAVDAGAHGSLTAEASSADASSEADDEPLVVGTLPECHWPSSVIPPTPSGAFAAGFIGRTYLFCESSLSGGGSEGYVCPSDGGVVCVPGRGETCFMACTVNQYAVATSPPDPATPGYTADADVIYPDPPPGCTQPLDAFVTAMNRDPDTEGWPTVECCPCE